MKEKTKNDKNEAKNIEKLKVEEEKTKIEEEKNKNEGARKKFSLVNIPIDESINISKKLLLTVKEVNERASQTDSLKIGTQILIDSEFVSVGGLEKKLSTKNIAKFGRFSLEFPNADITFGKDLNGISRKQFQIIRKNEVYQ